MALKNSKHPQWKGSKVGYFALHTWVQRNYGKENYCEICTSTNKSRYEWANVTGRYNRLRKNWKRLCVACHRKFDLKYICPNGHEKVNNNFYIYVNPLDPKDVRRRCKLCQINQRKKFRKENPDYDKLWLRANRKKNNELKTR